MSLLLREAELVLKFDDQDGIERCRNCNKPKDDHVNGQCLFESSRFEDSAFSKFRGVVQEGTKGAKVTLTANGVTLQGFIRAVSSETGWCRDGQVRDYTLRFTTTNQPVLIEEGDADAAGRS